VIAMTKDDETDKEIPEGNSETDQHHATQESSESSKENNQDESFSTEEAISNLIDGLASITSTAFKIATETTDKARDKVSKALDAAAFLTEKTSRAIDESPDQLRRMADAGESLKDMREVAGMTLSDLAETMKSKDKSFFEKVENGKESLSLEMILRMASLYARNDPLPFIMKYLRSYSPRLWEVLKELGLDALSLKLERERDFINIYRSRDAARKLSDEGFAKLLNFTQQSFDMALELIAEQEQTSDTEANEELEASDIVVDEEAEKEAEQEAQNKDNTEDPLS